MEYDKFNETNTDIVDIDEIIAKEKNFLDTIKMEPIIEKTKIEEEPEVIKKKKMMKATDIVLVVLIAVIVVAFVIVGIKLL